MNSKIYINRFYLFLIFQFVWVSSINAQHQEISEKPTTWKEQGHGRDADSNSVLYAFKHGHFSGHFRYYFMTTNNDSGLSDYYANAAGGGVKFESANFHKFQFGVSGFYIYNIGSSDLTKKDQATNLPNRYEIGLFDIKNPENKKNIDRLEEFYLKYNFKRGTIIFGKQLLNTPFINLQDGRMRPTEIEGLWADINTIPKTNISGGYIYGISPRSTVEYFKVSESIGIYSQGINHLGHKANYYHHLESIGIFQIGVSNKSLKNTKLQLWNMYVENIFNSTFLEAENTIVFKNNSKLNVGVQFIFQSALNNGGNADPTKTYFEKSGKSLAYGTKLAYNLASNNFSLNYNRITKQGRYLMPREWGRDPFYTFLPRERNEGLADVHAITFKFNKTLYRNAIDVGLGIGYYDLPEIDNYKFNKYAMPSYGQLNLDFKYKFDGIFKGFNAQLLFVRKINMATNVEENKAIYFNKVNMSHLDFILNFHF